jgi:hypothetical protein
VWTGVMEKGARLGVGARDAARSSTCINMALQSCPARGKGVNMRERGRSPGQRAPSKIKHSINSF